MTVAPMIEVSRDNGSINSHDKIFLLREERIKTTSLARGMLTERES